MIPKECKRLAEVDFPIAEVSRHAVREKSIRHGHPRTLHLWWARRPLASSRAVLMALLLPDPCDPHCPEGFKSEARRLLPKVVGTADPEDIHLRARLLQFIGNFANWKLAADRTCLDVSRALVKAAHGEKAPLVVDPFAGGGSIPLEALRLGCEAFASDLNPVACLILKTMLEDIPRHGPELAGELCRVSDEIKIAAERELADLYPVDLDGATPIAYLWARTVRCESPKCGAEIPLMRSFWLCKKPERKLALRHRVERSEGATSHVEFEIFGPEAARDVRESTVDRAKATCLCCGAVLPPSRVREQLGAQKGGADVVFDEQGERVGGARMTAVVTLKPGQTGRYYRLPTDADYTAVRKAQMRVTAILEEWKRDGKRGLCPVPDELLPPIGTLGFRVQRYGMLQWGDLFTARQKAAHRIVVAVMQRIAIETLPIVSLSMGKLLRHCNVLSKWHRGSETTAGAFGMQSLPMSWDFPEMHPLAPYSGGLQDALGDVAESIYSIVKSSPSVPGQSEIADAADYPLPDQAANIWFTDPPYYDAIPYSDLSDFFFVWLKRVLPVHPLLSDPFDPDNPLSHKTREAVQDETRQQDGRPKDPAWFEETMAKAFAEGRRVLGEDGVGSIVFAHKTTKGWEALLSGMIRGGWTVTGSWPVATERGARLRARDSAALATSVHLICRPRPDNALVGDWADVLRKLSVRVGDWMERLQGEGVHGADLVFACIGPALEIFSRCRVVETAEGLEVGLPKYLEKVWEVVSRTALKQVLGTAEAKARNGSTGALEEDARLTALFLWTLRGTEASEENSKEEDDEDGEDDNEEENEEEEDDEDDDEKDSKIVAKVFALPFDVVRRFAQPMGIDLDTWTGRIIEQKKGVVRLLPVVERAKTLFGNDGTSIAADWLENNVGGNVQTKLFPGFEKAPRMKNRLSGNKRMPDGDVKLPSIEGATTLDRVHEAMLLQASGHADALRKLINTEQDRGPDFLRLANALSALYPRGSREKRILDAMLLAVPK